MPFNPGQKEREIVARVRETPDVAAKRPNERGKLTSFLYCCFSWRRVATSTFRARFLSSSSRNRFTLLTEWPVACRDEISYLDCKTNKIERGEKLILFFKTKITLPYYCYLSSLVVIVVVVNKWWEKDGGLLSILLTAMNSGIPRGHSQEKDYPDYNRFSASAGFSNQCFS